MKEGFVYLGIVCAVIAVFVGGVALGVAVGDRKTEERLEEKWKISSNQQQLIQVVNQLNARVQKLEQPGLPEATE